MSEEATSKPRSDDCIQVVVRCRPANAKEKNDGRKNIISIDMVSRSVSELLNSHAPSRVSPTPSSPPSPLLL